jgi:tRNA G18 (ribose-2'-O)-methylase SpoU
LLESSDAVVEIPMLGQKESFNVAVSTGIALNELRRKSVV